MNESFKNRIKYYLAVIGIALVFVLYPIFTEPRIQGGLLKFELPDVNGATATLDAPQWKDKVLMVNIWGRWCPPCQQEIPYLIELQNTYRDQGFEIIGVEFPMPGDSTDEEFREALKKFQEETGINYTLLTAGSPDDVPLYFPDLKNFKGFPTNIFIGRDGQVDTITVGFRAGDIPKYEALIEKLLAQ